MEEIMNVNEVKDEIAGVNLSTGAAIAIGAGVTAAVFAGIGLVKRGIAAIKAKKAQQESEYEFVEDEA
jgi:hypothetical protein